MNPLNDFTKAFVPLFFAMNAIGVVPIYISLTTQLEKPQKSKLLKEACFAAFAVAGVFIFTGQLIFKGLGITADDFRIGGGLVLMLIGIIDILFSKPQEQRRSPSKEIGIVPLGIPLIVGPGALTTLIMVVETVGYFYAALALTVNLIFIWIVFINSDYIVKVMGRGGTAAFGKIASLFLIAIGVMLIRVGISGFLN